jgi:hypothetical protein
MVGMNAVQEAKKLLHEMTLQEAKKKGIWGQHTQFSDGNTYGVPGIPPGIPSGIGK